MDTPRPDRKPEVNVPRLNLQKLPQGRSDIESPREKSPRRVPPPAFSGEYRLLGQRTVERGVKYRTLHPPTRQIAPATTTTATVKARLDEMQAKKGLELAEAMVDFGRNVILSRGFERLDEASVKMISDFIYNCIDDQHWAVRMDNRWIVDLLFTQGYLNERTCDSLSKAISKQLQNETDARVRENSQKLLRFLATETPRAPVFQPNQAPARTQNEERLEVENQKQREFLLREQQRSAELERQIAARGEQNRILVEQNLAANEAMRRQEVEKGQFSRQLEEQRQRNIELQGQLQQKDSQLGSQEKLLTQLRQIQKGALEEGEKNAKRVQEQEIEIAKLREQSTHNQVQTESLRSQLTTEQKRNSELTQQIQEKDTKLSKDKAQIAFQTKQLAEKEADIQKKTQENKKQNSEKDKEIRKLESDVKRLNKEVLVERGSSEDYQTQMEQLEAQLQSQHDAAKEKEAEFTAQIAALRKEHEEELNAAQSVIQASEKNIENLRSQLQEQREVSARVLKVSEKTLNQSKEKEEKYEFQLSEAKTENKHLKQEIEKRKEENITLDLKNIDLEGDIQTRDREIAKLNENLKKKDEHVDKVNSVTKKLTKELEKEVEKQKVANKTTLEELQQVKKSLKELEKTNQDLQRDKNRLINEKTRLESENKKSQEALRKQATAQMLESKTPLKDVSEINSLKQNVKELENKLIKQEQALNDAISHEQQALALNTKLKAEKLSADSNYAQLVNENKQKENIIYEKEGELSSIQQQVSALEEELEGQKADFKNQADVVLQLRKQVAAQRKQIEEAEANQLSLDELRTANQQLKQDLEKAKTRDTAAARQQQTQEAQLNEAKKQATAGQKEVARLSQDMKSLTERLAVAEQEATTYQSVLEKELDSYRAATTRANALEKANQGLTGQMAEKDAQVAQLSSQLGRQQTEIERLTAQMENASTVNTTLQQQYSKALSDYQSWVVHAKNLEGQVNASTAANESLQNQLAELVNLNETAQKQVVALEGERAELQAKLEDKARAQQEAARIAAEKIAAEKIAQERAAREAAAAKQAAAKKAAEEVARKAAEQAAAEKARAEEAARKGSMEKMTVEQALKKATDLTTSLSEALPQLKTNLLEGIRNMANSAVEGNPDMKGFADALNRISVTDLPLTKSKYLTHDWMQVQNEAEEFATKKTASMWRTPRNESAAGQAFNQERDSYIESKKAEMEASQIYFRNLIRSNPDLNLMLGTDWEKMELALTEINKVKATVEEENRSWTKVKTFTSTKFTLALESAKNAARQMADIQKIQIEPINTIKEQIDQLINAIESQRPA